MQSWFDHTHNTNTMLLAFPSYSSMQYRNGAETTAGDQPHASIPTHLQSVFCNQLLHLLQFSNVQVVQYRLLKRITWTWNTKLIILIIVYTSNVQRSRRCTSVCMQTWFWHLWTDDRHAKINHNKGANRMRVEPVGGVFDECILTWIMDDECRGERTMLGHGALDNQNLSITLALRKNENITMMSTYHQLLHAHLDPACHSTTFSQCSRFGE